MIDSLEAALRPVTKLLNRNIAASTPARDLCQQLAVTTVAVRVRDTALAMYFTISDSAVALSADSEKEPELVITGSLLTLARMAGTSGEQAIRNGTLDLTGDMETAQAFHALLMFAALDIEEELSGFVGDVAAHRLGEVARGVRDWARDARSLMASNVREYLQEESRDVPSRYEVERFASQVDSLRDDVERLAARLDRIDRGS